MWYILIECKTCGKPYVGSTELVFVVALITIDLLKEITRKGKKFGKSHFTLISQMIAILEKMTGMSR